MEADGEPARPAATVHEIGPVAGLVGDEHVEYVRDGGDRDDHEHADHGDEYQGHHGHGEPARAAVGHQEDDDRVEADGDEQGQSDQHDDAADVGDATVEGVGDGHPCGAGQSDEERVTTIERAARCAQLAVVRPFRPLGARGEDEQVGRDRVVRGRSTRLAASWRTSRAAAGRDRGGGHRPSVPVPSGTNGDAPVSRSERARRACPGDRWGRAAHPGAAERCRSEVQPGPDVPEAEGGSTGDGCTDGRRVARDAERHRGVGARRSSDSGGIMKLRNLALGTALAVSATGALVAVPGVAGAVPPSAQGTVNCPVTGAGGFGPKLTAAGVATAAVKWHFLGATPTSGTCTASAGVPNSAGFLSPVTITGVKVKGVGYLSGPLNANSCPVFSARTSPGPSRRSSRGRRRRRSRRPSLPTRVVDRSCPGRPSTPSRCRRGRP